MPSVQRGELQQKNGHWRARFYDEQGVRRVKGGFGTGREGKRRAATWLHEHVERIEAIRRGDVVAQPRETSGTIDALIDAFLERHGRTIDPATKRKLTAQLRHARQEFGDRVPDALHRVDLEDWREQLPAGSRHDVFRALRQVLAWGVERDLCARNAAAGIQNPKRKRHERREVRPFETWDDVHAVADELDSRYRAVPILAVGCGLRPEELFALRRSDIDRTGGVLHVRRRFTGGVLKDGGKTDGSVRAVPLRRVVIDALEAMPTRIDSPLLFPASRGGHIDAEKFRHREWTPALRAAGIEHRRLYDCRHTFATWAIEGGLHLFYVARVMGTSVAQLEDTYAHWLVRTDEQLRVALDAYDAKLATGTHSGAQTP